MAFDPISYALAKKAEADAQTGITNANNALSLAEWGDILAMNPSPNLLTLNQAECTNALNNTTGFGGGGGGTSTLSSSTVNPLPGQTKSLNVLCTTGVDREGATTNVTTVVNGTVYTIYANVIAPVDATMQMWWSSNGIVSTSNFIGTGQQQIVSCGGAAGTTTGAIYAMLLNTQSAFAGKSFQIRGLILRQGSS